jgi:drug/metabolite transporter (DMT)-like permease
MSLRIGIEALLSVVLWGASFVATKAALAELSPLAVIVLRFAIGLAVIVGVLARRRQLVAVRRADVGWLALLGLNGITVHQMLQAQGLVTTTATNSAWIVATIPVFTAILARFVVGEAFGPLKVFGFALAAFGTILIVGRGDLTSTLPRHVATGDWLMLISALNWAIFTAACKRIIDRYPPAVLIAYVMAFGWLMMLPPLALDGGWRAVAHLSAGGWVSVLFLGVGCSGLAYVFWYDALGQVDASVLASFIYLEPIVTVILAAILLGERMTWAVGAGGALIVAGVRLVNQRRRA